MSRRTPLGKMLRKRSRKLKTAYRNIDRMSRRIRELKVENAELRAQLASCESAASSTPTSGGREA